MCCKVRAVQLIRAVKWQSPRLHREQITVPISGNGARDPAARIQSNPKPAIWVGEPKPPKHPGTSCQSSQRPIYHDVPTDRWRVLAPHSVLNAKEIPFG